MLRRRLRLVCSSDEEEDEQPQIQPQQQREQEQLEEDDDIEIELQESTLNLQTVTLNTSNPNPNGSIASEPFPLEISDDDFEDVSDNLAPPSPPPPPPMMDHSFQSSSASRVSSSNSDDGSDCPISGFLWRLGLKLRREWLDSCIGGLESSVPGFAGFDIAAKSKLCFEQFLISDMNYSGGGFLPQNVHDMHLVDLTGPFVLQVDEIVNISCPLRGRYQNAASGIKRCVKLSMTDGVQRVFGMEYRPIKDLDVLAPAGMKVAICNVNIRHGLLMLVPEVIEVIGGLVEELEAARQRLVHEVNKPPRGKRTRTGEVPSLATRATLAAWPPDSVSVPGQTRNSISQAATPLQPINQGFSSNASTSERTMDERYSRTSTGEEPSLATRAMPAAWPKDGVSVPGQNRNFTLQVATPLEPNNRGSASDVATSERMMEESTVPNCRDRAEPNASSTTVFDVEDIQMVDGVEHPFVQGGDREVPFTYLSSLSTKWASMKDKALSVHGKIKCFLTGVKGFQYKQRTTFELRVYVDDGSLISEVLIDHNVVRKGIGYSPEEVTAALTSSDKKRVSDMKETMKQFQIFLVNFEGTMVVQINDASSIPIAIEMNQGCPASDAWLLLRRLKPSYSSPLSQHSHLNPIDLSP